MKQQELHKIMGRAEAMCSHSGARLTEKRRQILELLLRSKIPLSAYEIAAAYNRAANTGMPAMSVYRILDFLQAELLVHKLSSANKYVACAHIACDHAHEVPQFLICAKCQAVKEIAVPRSIIAKLDREVMKTGYQLMSSQLELQCLCGPCLERAA